MSEKHKKHPCIQELVQTFISRQWKVYTSDTVARYRNVLNEWQSFLEGWAWEGLEKYKPEAQEYAKNSRYKTYCTIFSADMVVYSVWYFLGTDIEVDYGVSGAKYAAMVLGKLAAWLRDEDYISDEDHDSIRREIKDFRARLNN
ncbi:MAG: hypothetical protein GYA24_01170 [Candidatus Lokiarchaeota archaeon]|nr:hypothetical protein [Candidatus Lokiarchaeota archaeon]